MSRNTTEVVLAGGKRRTISCDGCGAIMCFYNKKDHDSWCRRHGRVCAYMKVNFHKYTDIPWVTSTRINARSSIHSGVNWDTTVVRARDPAPTVEDLIGSVGGMAILDAVDIITRRPVPKRQISDSSMSTSSVSTITAPESPHKNKKAAKAPQASQIPKFRKQIEMIPAEVNLLFSFTFCTILLTIYHFFKLDSS